MMHFTAELPKGEELLVICAWQVGHFNDATMTLEDTFHSLLENLVSWAYRQKSYWNHNMLVAYSLRHDLPMNFLDIK